MQSIAVLSASHPWSNKSPRGEELLVFLAYFPSALSNIYLFVLKYKNISIVPYNVAPKKQIRNKKVLVFHHKDFPQVQK